MKNKPVVIVCGDPESTFNEILVKTLKDKVFKKVKHPVIIICSKKLLQNELKRLKKNINFQSFNNHIKLLKKKVYLIDIPLDFKNLTLIKKLCILQCF